MSDQSESPKNLSSDAPIVAPEADQLGYAGFAENVAKSIRHMTPPEGLVMAVYGPWGSGKTSVINLVRHALSNPIEVDPRDPEIVTVSFNPWWFSGQENLTSAFFREVSAALGDKLGNDVGGKLKELGKRVSGAKGLIAAAMNLVPIPGVPAAASTLSEFLAFLSEGNDTRRTLEDDLEDLREALKNQPKRILIIVDDIDRLLPDEARQIFRLIKSVADLPNVTYLLAFDRHIADRLMEDDDKRDGPHFLEKIVQVPFDLPSPDRFGLRQLFFTQVDQIVGDAKIKDERRWHELFHTTIDPILATPRDVVRLVNALRVTWPAVEGDVDLADLITIEAIRVFEPGLYKGIQANQAFLPGGGDLGHQIKALADKEYSRRFADGLADRITEPRRTSLRAGLPVLFPDLKKAWPEVVTLHANAHQASVDRRICAAEHFGTYFRLVVGEETLTSADIGLFLERCGDPEWVEETILNALSIKLRDGKTKVSIVLEEFANHIDSVDSKYLAGLLHGLLRVADRVQVPSDDWRGFTTESNLVRMHRCVRPILRRLESVSRGCELNDHARNGVSLGYLTDLVCDLGLEHGRIGMDRKLPVDERLIDEETLDQLESIIGERLNMAAEANKILDLSDSTSVLFRWAEFRSDDEVQCWVNNRIESGDAALLRKLSEAVVSIGYGSNGPIPRIAEGIRKLVDIDKLLLRLQVLAESPEGSECAASALEGLTTAINNRR